MKNEIEEVVKAWKRDNLVRNLSPESMETYSSSARDFMRFFNDNKIYRMKQLTDDVVKEYILIQKERHCSARTVNNRLKALRRVCHFYEEEIKPGYTIPDFTLQHEDMAQRSPLTDDEVCALMRNFSPKNSNSVLVAFILDTGARSKSVRNVLLSDVDLEGGYVTFRVTKNRDVLVLPLSGILKNLLRLYVQIHNIKDGPLFPNADGGIMYDRSSIYKAVKKYMNECGIKKSGVHLFRYTFGKIMVQNNCNAMLLQKWFGHHTMDETKRYIKLYSNELKNVCEDVTPLALHGKIFEKLASEC